MRKLLAFLPVVVALLAFAAPAAAGPCGLPDTRPLWIEFGDPAADFAHTVFRQPGLIVATSKPAYAQSLRDAGTHTVYWDMHMNKRVGTPSKPADPATIADWVEKLFTFSASTTGCATPVIALNELFGTHLPTPWSRTNRRYRANVLALIQGLAERGARPVLLIPRRPATKGAAAGWWRAVAADADIVRQVYVPATRIARMGQADGYRHLEQKYRQGVRELTAIGIPRERIGIMLGFHTTRGFSGREGLRPADRWFGVVQLKAQAARRVAAKERIGSVWSWGWGVWSRAEADPDKAGAACVYLWSRDPGLCDPSDLVGPDFALWLRPPPEEVVCAREPGAPPEC
jgi:hypothetical protein